MEKLSKKKGKGSKAEKKEAKKNAKDEVEDEPVDENADEFVTTVRTRNDLLIDYSIILNVKERLEILTQERFKGKFNMPFHIQVLTQMAD